jgi:nicotinamide-nucleotide amidase
MDCEIFSTGDEIRTGALADTNAAWLAGELEEAGVRVRRHQCVGDDVEMIMGVLKEIGGRADMAVVTGGLGPTSDDVTAEAAAKAGGVDWVLDARALETVQAYFAARKRPMPESNQKQALVPKGADVLYNPVGTAPGFAMTIGKCRFFFMPGVPFEMKRMFTDQVLPRILELQGPDRGFNRVKTFSTFGIPEAVAGEMLVTVSQEFPGIILGLRARFPEIQVKLYARGKNLEFLDRQMREAEKWVLDRLGNKVFSVKGESMEAVVGNLLRSKGADLAVAESCTGGLISTRMTDVAGSSDYFLLGTVVYANDAKMKLLGVRAETLADHGAVSDETAGEMADGVRRLAGAAYGLATTGIAGPGGGSDEKPVGTLCIGLASPQQIRTWRFLMTFTTRAMYKSMFAMKALDLLRRELMGISL